VYNADDLGAEAREALDKIWFVQSLEVTERTDFTLSLRLYIRPDLFVQAFLGELTGSLYLALIEGNERVFGVDREASQWHLHPFEAPDKHEPLSQSLEPKPLLRFLARVEGLLIQHDLL
jgi:hypothetical protein